MKKWIIYVTIFSLGIVFGGCIMAFLAKSASTTFIKMLLADDENSERVAAQTANLNHEWGKAAFHYRNVVNIFSRSMGKAYESEWSLTLPLAAPVLAKIAYRAHPTGAGKRLQEAIYRAKLAAALEQEGKVSEASEEYTLAMKLIGDRDIQRVKKLAQLPPY